MKANQAQIQTIIALAIQINTEGQAAVSVDLSGACHGLMVMAWPAWALSLDPGQRRQHQLISEFVLFDVDSREIAESRLNCTIRQLESIANGGMADVA